MSLLNPMAQVLEEEVAKATKSQAGYTAFLERLVEEELVDKTDRSINARIAKARFPAIRTLEAFDFSYQPGLPVTLIKELARLDFLERAENLVLVGPPGTGKSMLAIGLAVKACQARKRVLFTHAPTLLDHMVAATVDHSLGRRLGDMQRLDLLVVDELGYKLNFGKTKLLLKRSRAARGRTTIPTQSNIHIPKFAPI